jgi:hypothetical protein
MKMLKITNNKGFRITFENGLTASVQWGCGNYCDNHFNYELGFDGKTSAQSNNAEVAVFDEHDDFMNIDQFVPEEVRSDDVVAGWLTPDQIADFLMAVKNYQGENQND